MMLLGNIGLHRAAASLGDITGVTVSCIGWMLVSVRSAFSGNTNCTHLGNCARHGGLIVLSAGAYAIGMLYAAIVGESSRKTHGVGRVNVVVCNGSCVLHMTHFG